MDEHVNQNSQATKGANAEEPALQELRRRLTEPEDWPGRFRRLAEAIAQVEDISCGACQALLDVYIDAELAHHDPRRRYPELWQHLQACADCAVAHDLLFETLAQAREGQLEPLPRLQPPRLPFLNPVAPEASWSVRLRSRLAGAPFGLTFTLNPAYLSDLLTPTRPIPVRTRGIGQRPQSLPLLADTIPLDSGQVAVELVAVRDDQNANRLHLQATIAGTAPLPQNLWAVLKWGDETRSGVVDEKGQVDLGEVSVDALQAALATDDQVFEITFEERGTEQHAGSPAG